MNVIKNSFKILDLHLKYPRHQEFSSYQNQERK